MRARKIGVTFVDFPALQIKGPDLDFRKPADFDLNVRTRQAAFRAFTGSPVSG